MVPPGHSNLWVFSVNFDFFFQLFFGDTLSRIHRDHSLRDTFEKHFAFTLHVYCFLVINSASCLTIRTRTGLSMDRRTTNVLTHTNHIPVMQNPHKRYRPNSTTDGDYDPNISELSAILETASSNPESLQKITTLILSNTAIKI